MRIAQTSFVLLAFLAPPTTAQGGQAGGDLAVPAPAPATPPTRVSAVAVRLFIEGPVMRVEQAITVQNPADVEQDFELVFPLGRGEVVSALTARVDGRELEGALFSAKQAREIFRRMAREGRDPTLLEHYGEGLYRARIATLAPGAERTVTLAYSRLVDTDADRMRIHVPLTAFRRSAGPVQLTIEGEIRSLHRVSTLYSPTHQIVEGRPWVSWEDTTQHQHLPFRVEDPSSFCETDFEAFYKTRPDGGLLDVTVLSERPDPDEDGYFLAVIHGTPDDTIVPEPKNVVFVIDRSGSMQGDKIIQACAALALMIEKLRPEDRFNIVSYSKDVTLFAEQLRAPTAAVLADAHSFIEAIAADGGTNIGQALTAAADQFGDDGLVNQIVFVTDGLPTEGEKDTSRLCALVRDANRHEARLVAFGLGFDVNGVLLDRLAEENHGMSEYVLPDQDVREKVTGFYARMHAPLLLNTELTISGTEVRDLFPRAVGDIYGGHNIVLTGRYSKSGRARLTIRGTRGVEAQQHEFDLELAADTSRSGRDLVARIWAAKKIGFLVDEIRLDGETPERVEAIVRLGTRFGILTEYTAFLADEATDLFAIAANSLACSIEIKGRVGVVSGSHGVAQACNSKFWQRGDQVLTANRWFGADGAVVTITGVQCIAGKAFFKRGGTWRQSDMANGDDIEEVELYSDDFFALLDRNHWLGRCIARTGDITLAIEGRNVRVKSAGS